MPVKFGPTSASTGGTSTILFARPSLHSMRKGRIGATSTDLGRAHPLRCDCVSLSTVFLAIPKSRHCTNYRLSENERPQEFGRKVVPSACLGETTPAMTLMCLLGHETMTLLDLRTFPQSRKSDLGNEEFQIVVQHAGGQSKSTHAGPLLTRNRSRFAAHWPNPGQT